MDELMLELPECVENLKLPDPSLLQYYKDIDERVVWIDCEIDSSLLDVVKLIIEINRKDRDIQPDERSPIKLCIFSYGGDVEPTIALLDVCALSKTPIITINVGVAFSAGLWIFLAGHKRYAMPRSQFLYHSGSSSGSNGTYEQTQAYADNYKKRIDLLRGYIITQTNIEPKLFNRQKNKEWFIYADEAVSLGICDGIVESIEDVL